MIIVEHCQKQEQSGSRSRPSSSDYLYATVDKGSTGNTNKVTHSDVRNAPHLGDDDDLSKFYDVNL